MKGREVWRYGHGRTVVAARGEKPGSRRIQYIGKAEQIALHAMPLGDRDGEVDAQGSGAAAVDELGNQPASSSHCGLSEQDLRDESPDDVDSV